MTHSKAPRRLAIFTTHPIQYQSPWFQALATEADLDIRVHYSYVPDARAQGEGFGTAFSWDLPLREGFASCVLSGTDGVDRGSYLGRAWEALGSFRPHAALVLGWQHRSLLEAMAACRLSGVPVVLRGESNLLRERAGWKAFGHRALFAQASAFLAIGEANAAFFRGRGVSADRIVMAKYCVDNDRFRSASLALAAERAQLRAAWGIEDGRFCVLFAGKLEPKKRVLDVLSAAHTVQSAGLPVHALIVGAGEQMAEAQRFVAAHGVRATFAGFLNQTQLPQAYAAADALVLPSDAGETWGLVCNEAMASGIPAIVSERVGCANDLVLDGRTGGVATFGDPQSIARILSAWIADPSLYASVRANAQRHVESYSIANAVAGLKRAVSIALGGGPRT